MGIRDLILRISYFRTKANISARDLSFRIGKHGGYINKLECRDFNLPASVLLDILGELNVSCEEFFADNFMTYKIDKQLSSMFGDLSAENKETILSLIKKLR